MKFISQLVLISLIALPTAWASCDVDNVSYVRTTSFGFSFSSDDSGSSLEFNGGLETEVNIPMRYENKRGCFKQSAALDFEIKEKNEIRNGSINIYAPKIEFKNVPGRLMSYIHISTNLNDGSNQVDINEVNFEIANITCIDDEVLSVHGFSGNISTMDMFHKAITPNSRIGTNLFIATGQAAKNLRNSLPKENQKLNQFKLRYLPINLAKAFSKRVGDKTISELNTKQKYFVPKVFAAYNLNALGFSISDVFETQVGTHSACSKEFETTMKDYQFKSFKGNISGIKLKAKLKKTNGRKYLNLKWKS
jgi:hypothetical protein